MWLIDYRELLPWYGAAPASSGQARVQQRQATMIKPQRRAQPRGLRLAYPKPGELAGVPGLPTQSGDTHQAMAAQPPHSGAPGPVDRAVPTLPPLGLLAGWRLMPR